MPPELDGHYEYFRQYREDVGDEPRTLRQIRYALGQLRDWIDDNYPGTEPHEVTRKMAREYYEWIRENHDYAATTYQYRIRTIASMYDTMADEGYTEYQLDDDEKHPWRKITDSFNEPRGTEHRRYISREEMARWIRSLDHPIYKTVIIMLAKTTIRLGELCNLDLRDIHLNDEEVKQLYDDLGTEPRPELKGYPDSMFIPYEPSVDQEYNGEVRKSSNKRVVGTRIPIDDELKASLKRTLAVRPDYAPTNALYVTLGRNYQDRVGQHHLAREIRLRTKENGWWSDDGGAEDNVTAHYFRHWSTTRLEQKLPPERESLVDYIRGDSDSDKIRKRYTHHWHEETEPYYLDAVPKFF